MSSYPGAQEPDKPKLRKRAVPLMILLVALGVAAKLALTFLMEIFWIVVLIVVVVAILWALNQLL